MVDTLTTLEEKAPVNTFLTVMFALPVFTLGWISIFAFQNSQLELLATGLAFIPLAIFMDWLSSGKIFRSTGSWGLMSFSFSLPIFLLEFANFAAGVQFSVYSVASEGYLSSILSSAPPAVRAAVNIFIAPILETGVFVSVTLVLFAAMMFLTRRVYPFTMIPTGLDSIIAGFLAVQPAAYSFSELHGNRGPEFKILAYIVMNVMLLPGIFEDQLKGTFIPFLGVGSAFISGLHIALNMSNQGGVFSFFGTLLSVEGSVIVAHIAIILFMMTAMISGAAYLYNKTGGKILPFTVIKAWIRGLLPF